MFAPFGRGVTESVLPYIREGLTLSKQEKQSFTCLKHESERLKYLPSANFALVRGSASCSATF